MYILIWVLNFNWCNLMIFSRSSDTLVKHSLSKFNLKLKDESNKPIRPFIGMYKSENGLQLDLRPGLRSRCDRGLVGETKHRHEIRQAFSCVP